MKGIGTDILLIKNIETYVENIDDPFVRKCYTEREIELILGRSRPLYSFATRFCAKEAVFKCLGSDGEGVRLNEIEVLEHDTGQPCVILHGKVKKIAEERGIREILISLSYDADYAIAFAAAI